MSSKLGVQNIAHTNGTNAMTISSGGIVIPKGVILQVQASDTDQSFDPSSGFGKVEWESVEIDTIGGWDATNHRYTPSVAGYYLCGGSVRVLTSGGFQTASFEIRKSDTGTGVSSGALRNQFQFTSDLILNSELPLPTGMLLMNGSSDFIEVYVDSDETITLHDNDARRSHFFATLVHAV